MTSKTLKQRFGGIFNKTKPVLGFRAASITDVVFSMRGLRFARFQCKAEMAADAPWDIHPETQALRPKNLVRSLESLFAPPIRSLSTDSQLLVNCWDGGPCLGFGLEFRVWSQGFWVQCLGMSG